MNNTSVDSYLAEGCGRCDFFQTPECKVHRWADGLRVLRAMLHETALTETMKWGAPCYTLDGTNVLMISALREHFVLSFFRGAELADPAGLLELAGPNTREARVMRFTSIEQVREKQQAIGTFVSDAIAIQRSGLKPTREPAVEPMPEALRRRLAADAPLAAAFAALTPGRQRSHILHISGAKAEATQERRVEQCAPKIFAGKGYNER